MENVEEEVLETTTKKESAEKAGLNFSHSKFE